MCRHFCSWKGGLELRCSYVRPSFHQRDRGAHSRGAVSCRVRRTHSRGVSATGKQALLLPLVCLSSWSACPAGLFVQLVCLCRSVRVKHYAVLGPREKYGTRVSHPHNTAAHEWGLFGGLADHQSKPRRRRRHSSCHPQSSTAYM